MDDAELAVRAAAGRTGAFEDLLDRYGGRVRAVALRISGGDAALADDLTQEVFVHLLRVLPRYEPTRPFAPWLFRVATNLCRNRARDLRRRRAASLDAHEAACGERTGAAADPAETLERADDLRRVREARDRLPEAYRAILALRYEAGLALEDVAAALGGLPMGTVKNRLFRARAALAAQLGLPADEEERR
jgi:RNA polymerase sigma factor (sigma-70 family)